MTEKQYEEFLNKACELRDSVEHDDEIKMATVVLNTKTGTLNQAGNCGSRNLTMLLLNMAIQSHLKSVVEQEQSVMKDFKYLLFQSLKEDLQKTEEKE